MFVHWDLLAFMNVAFDVGGWCLLVVSLAGSFVDSVA